tara:strand:- start:769 stop:2745 length:1977 start_codon:yes stop_codon:yes gene_type:complete
MSLPLPSAPRLLLSLLIGGCALALAACENPASTETATLPPLAEDAPWWSVIEHETALRMVLSPDGTRMAWSQSFGGSSYLMVAPAGQPEAAIVRQIPAWDLLWTPREGLVATIRDASIVEPGTERGDWHTRSQIVADTRNAYLRGTPASNISLFDASLDNPPANWGYIRSRGLAYNLVAYQEVSADSSLLAQRIPLEDSALHVLPLGEDSIAVATIHQAHPGAPVALHLVHPFGAPVELGASGGGHLEPIAVVSPDEPDRVYALSSIDSDQAELVILSLRTGEREFVARSAHGTSLHSPLLDTSQHLLAVHDNPASPRPVALVPGMEAALEILTGSGNTNPDDLSLTVAHATVDAAQVIFRRTTSDGQVGYVFVDTLADTATPFRLSERSSPPIRVNELRARSSDGRLIPAFLRQRVESESAAALIVSIHGGPMANDTAAPDLLAQPFLSRGLPVLAVNYRGSTGHGLEHERAGDLEYDGLMIRDIEAAIEAVFVQGLIERGTPVILFGHSFGGHLNIATARDNPGMACAVISLNPGSNLVTFQERGAPYLDAWGTAEWRRVYGNWYEPETRARLDAASATNRPDDWATPVAIIASREDPITPEDMVAEFAAIYQDDHLLPYRVVEGASHNFVPRQHDDAIGAALTVALAGPCRTDQD